MAPKIKSARETEQGLLAIFAKHLPRIYGAESSFSFAKSARHIIWHANALAKAQNQLRLKDAKQIEAVARKMVELDQEIKDTGPAAANFLDWVLRDKVNKITRLIPYNGSDGTPQEGRVSEPYWWVFQELLEKGVSAMQEIDIPFDPPVKDQQRDRRPNPYPLGLLISCADFWEERVEKLEVRSTLELTDERFSAFCADVFDLCLTEKAVPHSYWQHYREWRSHYKNYVEWRNDLPGYD